MGPRAARSDTATDADVAALRWEALRLAAVADECERAARLLVEAIAPLESLLGPITSLHHPATWTGAAADRSRDQLTARRRATAQVEESVHALASELADRATWLDAETDRLLAVAARIAGGGG